MSEKRLLHDAVSHGLILTIAKEFIEVDDMCVALGEAARIRTANWAPASEEKVVKKQRNFIWKLIEIIEVLRECVGNKESFGHLTSLHMKLLDLYELLDSFPFIGERGAAARLAWQETRGLFSTKVSPYATSFLNADPAIKVPELLRLVGSHFHSDVEKLYKELEVADTRLFIDRLKQADCIAVLNELTTLRRDMAIKYFKLLIENEGRIVEKRVFICRCHGKRVGDASRERKHIATLREVVPKHGFRLKSLTVKGLRALGRTTAGVNPTSVEAWSIEGEELRRLRSE